MKSAKELAEAVAKSVSYAIHTPIVLDIYGDAVDMISVRDREIIEKCRKAIHDRDWRGDGVWGDAVDGALDSVMRDMQT